jgi:hypothetical protein
MLQSLKLKSINLMAALAMVTLFTTLQSSSCSKDDVTGTDPEILLVDGGFLCTGTMEPMNLINSVAIHLLSIAESSVTAVKGASTINGSWSESSTRFVLNFGTDPVFSKLNQDWLKTEKTATTLKLKDDNPGKDEKLEFIKN